MTCTAKSNAWQVPLTIWYPPPPPGSCWEEPAPDPSVCHRSLRFVWDNQLQGRLQPQQAMLNQNMLLCGQDYSLANMMTQEQTKKFAPSGLWWSSCRCWDDSVGWPCMAISVMSHQVSSISSLCFVFVFFNPSFKEVDWRLPLKGLWYPSVFVSLLFLYILLSF